MPTETSLTCCFLRRPYADAELFPQFLEILLAAFAKQAGRSSDDVAVPAVHDLPPALAKLELSEAIVLLQQNPGMLSDQ